MATAMTGSDGVLVTCTCGVRANVPPRFAGRRFRCRGCGRVQRAGQQRAALRGGTARAQAEPRGGASDRPRSPYAPPKADLTATASARAPGQRDLDYEAHVAAMAIWLRVAGLIGMFGLGAVVLAGVGARVAAWVLPMMVLFGVLAGFFVVGRSLARYRGWARWVAIGLAGLAVLGSVSNVVTVLRASTLLGLAMSLGWNGAQIAVLQSGRCQALFTASYRDLVERDGRKVPYWRSPFLWVPLALIVLSFGLALVGL